MHRDILGCRIICCLLAVNGMEEQMESTLGPTVLLGNIHYEY